MRRLVAAALFMLLGATAAAGQSAVILVRHAERADTATGGPAMMKEDPELSSAGLARAESLANMLRDARITAIYTTEYRRTKQTAAPLAKILGLEPVVVPSKDLGGLAQRIKGTSGNVLVVGHSNTLPDIVKALGVSDSFTIPDSEFDNLVVVQRGSMVRLRY